MATVAQPTATPLPGGIGMINGECSDDNGTKIGYKIRLLGTSSRKTISVANAKQSRGVCNTGNSLRRRGPEGARGPCTR